jgi:SAM-dependent methyltransferase
VDATEPTLPQRLTALWDHLGLGAAHVAAQMPGDLAGFIAAAPQRIAGVVLCVPSRLDPAPFAGVAERLLMVAGDGDLTGDVTARALPRLPGATRHVLHGYQAPGWADVVADRSAVIAGWIAAHLPRFAADPPRGAADPARVTADPPRLAAEPPRAAAEPARATAEPARATAEPPRTADPPPVAADPLRAADQPRAPAEGVVAGITYRIQGAGPALVLLPFFLAPSQWDPAIPLLARDFSVVTLGGRHVGGIAALEDRAQAPSYRAMVRGLIEHMAPQPGETMLDIGSGSGALDRMVAHRWPANPLTAIDVNPFLQREAKALAAEDGLGDAIAFMPGSAEALPFPDASFDCVFTVTVLEECDADRALREAWRVLRPGGRIGVVVRAIDLPQWWNLDLPPKLRARAETPPQSVGPRGVADASLYRRLRAAGFGDLACFPSLVTLDRPDGPIWRYREDHVLSLLTPEETAVWRSLTASARCDGVLAMAHPMHCAVGRKAFPREQEGLG